MFKLILASVICINGICITIKDEPKPKCNSVGICVLPKKPAEPEKKWTQEDYDNRDLEYYQRLKELQRKKFIQLT
jgi:hypothetical protein